MRSFYAKIWEIFYLSIAIVDTGLGTTGAVVAMAAGVAVVAGLVGYLPNFFLSILWLVFDYNFGISKIKTYFHRMNLEERIEEQEEAQRYLEQKNVYEIMQSMV